MCSKKQVSALVQEEKQVVSLYVIMHYGWYIGGQFNINLHCMLILGSDPEVVTL